VIIHPMTHVKHVVAWGRHDPDYARNRILGQAFRDLGWTVSNFRPHLSALADLEATCRGLMRPDLVWLPGFRQRDVLAARRWCQRKNVPLLFDPLISAYAKQVFERRKFAPGSAQAERLRRREAVQLGAADLLLLDTPVHADFFAKTFNIPPARIRLVPLGAEEPLFRPMMHTPRPDAPFEVLFFGSFITLHGVENIVRAACQYQGPPVRWRFLGEGPARTACEQIAAGHSNVVFEGWTPYREIPEAISRSDLVLGVFATTPQADHTISNKVFQALACGRPVLTRASHAFPADATRSGGLIFISPDEPDALAQAVRALALDRAGMPARNLAARALFDAHFSRARIAAALGAALEVLSDGRPTL
jgi:glycosyltransferase involved in cell wall biosynthesis